MAYVGIGNCIGGIIPVICLVVGLLSLVGRSVGGLVFLEEGSLCGVVAVDMVGSRINWREPAGDFCKS